MYKFVSGGIQPVILLHTDIQTLFGLTNMTMDFSCCTLLYKSRPYGVTMGLHVVKSWKWLE